MLKSVAKAVAYWKAPVKTFVLFHPMKALKWGGMLLAAKFVFDRVAGRRERRA